MSCIDRFLLFQKFDQLQQFSVDHSAADL
jgi:hypothetical protein